MTELVDKVPYVIGVRGLQSVDVIDGGDTLAVQLLAADESEVCALLPIDVVSDLLFRLADVMSVRPKLLS